MSTTPILDALENDTLTATQWARRLKVAPSTISRWAFDGRVQYIRVGREIRITRPAMEAALRDSREARQRRHRDRTAGGKANRAAHSAEVEAALSKI